MGRQKEIAKDLLANIPTDVDVDTKDTLPISKLGESDKSHSAAEKKPAEDQPSESTRLKRPRSSATTTSRSLKHNAPWAPQITLEDKPVRASNSADDINVGVALSTALLLLGDLDRNAELSEYENYALMLQRSIQAIQHAHSFSVQAFENWKELANKKREAASLQKTNKSLQSKMKTLEDQADAAIKAQNVVEEKAESAEAIKKLKVPKDSPLRNADVIPFPFPPTPSQSDDESESEEETLAIQHAHSFSVQAFENWKELDKKREAASSLQKTNKSLQSKMKTLEDQADAAIKAQNVVEEKAESAEAIKKVLEAKK
ncbi:uncharacterized protein LOC114275112 [Camellia sinensis]|uniref:uncharacterized protein LOC114275112 n=1 Tax=Camellia sinensis TaxID=4442 RepID=UPI0010369482|nr:uncharacterized protein LOC114275112 [Camellia sinensis]